jgi:cellulose synthase/poly-beta-1,6-N-acetylglucosamine synthase-like glycosyltransferase
MSRARTTGPAGTKQHPAELLGEILRRRGLLSEEQLLYGLELQQGWGTRLGDIILAKGWVRAFDLYQALAEHYHLPFVNLLDEAPDPTLLSTDDYQTYSDMLVMPWRREGDVVVLATAEPGEAVTEFALRRFGDKTRFVVTSKFDIIWQLQSNADTYFSYMAVNGLSEKTPEQSAKQVFSGPQLLSTYTVLCLYLVLLAFYPIPALIAGNVIISIFLLFNFGLRGLLTWVGADRHIDIKVTDHQVKVVEDRSLPTYTVLAPMYKEPEVLPHLAHAIRELDYPLSKLDVKLILEEDDVETIRVAREQGLEGIFEIVRVPTTFPKTKPKALNYALNFSRGEYVTIYDAEDRPEPDQLKKAVIAFRQSPSNTACVQARLNYFNPDENWLTRMFTLEYSLWFDFYLPALEALRIPVPLGGTSNHFRMDVLRKVYAWDPFNVTEDADLGVRFTQLGYHVSVINSTTYEEANTHAGNWVRQRSRWIKGYMQTYLVHMRNPAKLYRSLGHAGFWGFQSFIGGTIVSTLAAPFLYAMYALWLLTQTQVMDLIFPPVLLYISLFNLLAGNGYLIYITALGAFKRHNYRLIPWALTVPLYWLMMSVAAYRALWQLIHKPFFWEKTTHGITKHAAAHPQPHA